MSNFFGTGGQRQPVISRFCPHANLAKSQIGGALTATLDSCIEQSPIHDSANLRLSSANHPNPAVLAAQGTLIN